MAILRVKNVAAGFVDPRGVFHPLRGSSDYDPDRAGDDYGSRTDNRGVTAKRTGKKVKYKSSTARARARALASEAGRKGARAKKRYTSARRRAVAKRRVSGRRVAGRRQNPLLSDTLLSHWEVVEVKELLTFIKSTKEFQAQYWIPVVRTLCKLKSDGSYNHSSAFRYMRRLADAADKLYMNGTFRNGIFSMDTRGLRVTLSKKVRDVVADELVALFEDKHVWRCGEYQSGRRRNPARRSRYEVYVGNLGKVYDGGSKSNAMKTFREYKEMSASGYGRVAGEDVTLFEDGYPIEEYFGTNSEEEWY